MNQELKGRLCTSMGTCMNGFAQYVCHCMSLPAWLGAPACLIELFLTLIHSITDFKNNIASAGDGSFKSASAPWGVLPTKIDFGMVRPLFAGRGAYHAKIDFGVVKPPPTAPTRAWGVLPRQNRFRCGKTPPMAPTGAWGVLPRQNRFRRGKAPLPYHAKIDFGVVRPPSLTTPKSILAW